MSNKEPKAPSRGVLDPATERAEFEAMMSGEPALTAEDIAAMEKELRDISAKNNRRGRTKFKLGQAAAKIVSMGTAKY